jgi:hypothetical protein
MEGIKMRFAHKILQEEWKDFESRHRDAIRSRTKRYTGRLEDDRKYGVAMKGATESVASFKHPIYERFIDMKKNYLGDVKSKWGVKQDVMTRRKGKPIHNRIIFGKLNPLSFRLMHELADNVKDYMRKRFKKN